MARKPRIPAKPAKRAKPVEPVAPAEAIEPVEPDEPEKPAEPEREEEKIPWLRRVENDGPSAAGPGSRLAGYAVGTALLIVAILVIGFAIALRHPAPGRDPRENPAGQLPDQSVPGKAGADNEEAGNEKTPASVTGTLPKPKPPSDAGKDTIETRPRKNNIAPAGPERRTGQEARGATRGNSLVQFGAYRSRAAAEAAWQRLSRDKPYSAAAHRIEQARVGDQTYYRLRAEVPASTRPCVGDGKIACMVVRQGH